jgi:hypothetical protein
LTSRKEIPMARERRVTASWVGRELHVTVEGPLDHEMAVFAAEVLSIMELTATAPARVVVVHASPRRPVDPLAGRLFEEHLPEVWGGRARVRFAGRPRDEVDGGRDGRFN